MAKDVTNTDKRETDMPETTHGGRVYRPLADIVETGDGVQLMLEMPGVASDDLDVTLEQRVLTIRGKVHPTAPEKLALVHAEYGEGDYEDIGESWRLAQVLGTKGIPNRVDPWGREWRHDWTTWRAMLPKYLNEFA